MPLGYDFLTEYRANKRDFLLRCLAFIVFVAASTFYILNVTGFDFSKILLNPDGEGLSIISNIIGLYAANAFIYKVVFKVSITVIIIWIIIGALYTGYLFVRFWKGLFKTL